MIRLSSRDPSWRHYIQVKLYRTLLLCSDIVAQYLGNKLFTVAKGRVLKFLPDTLKLQKFCMSFEAQISYIGPLKLGCKPKRRHDTLLRVCSRFHLSESNMKDGERNKFDRHYFFLQNIEISSLAILESEPFSSYSTRYRILLTILILIFRSFA